MTTPAQLRAAAEEAMKPLGERRIQLMRELEEITQQLKPLVLQAREVEVTLRRIGEITGITSNTVRAWEK
jgi:DNA-directed RNA polymerase specialized sigma24 family protein